MPAPPLKMDPKFGHFPRWPEDGDEWLHPEDVALVRTLVPSERIFRRDGTTNDGRFGLFHYGSIKFRARPALWQEVESEGFEIGDWVEVVSRGMTNTPRTGTISEMLWDGHAREIVYEIIESGQPIATRYTRDDLKHVVPPTQT